MPNAFVVAGAVYRLPPGASKSVEKHDHGRWMARYEGFRRFTEVIDTALVEGAMRGDRSKGHRIAFRCESVSSIVTGI